MKIMDLIEALKDQNSDIRTDVVRALGQIGVDTILALIKHYRIRIQVFVIMR